MGLGAMGFTISDAAEHENGEWSDVEHASQVYRSILCPRSVVAGGCVVDVPPGPR